MTTCGSCGATTDPETNRIYHVLDQQPSDDQIEEWVYDSVCDATDGCQVEPDGRCEHGHVSWLLQLGLI
jgi:hypothetical protein